MKRFIQYLLFYTILGVNFCLGMNSTSPQNVDNDGNQKSDAYESDDELFKHLKQPRWDNFSDTGLVYPHELPENSSKRLEEDFEDLPDGLKKNIIVFKKVHELGKPTRILSNIFIFAGELGTGKLNAAKAVAQKLRWPYLSLDCSPLGDFSAITYIEEKVKMLIAGHNNKSCVIILDEISHVSQETEDKWNNNIEMHKIRALLDRIQHRKNILFIGTTNHINLVSDAICSRSNIVFFKKLTPMEKANKFKQLLSSNLKLQLHETTWKTLNGIIADYDLHDIERLVSHTYTNAWTRSSYADGEIIVTNEDVLSALEWTSANLAMLKKAKNEKSYQ